MPTLLSAVSCFVVVGLTIVLALVEPVSAHFDGYVFEDDMTTMPEAVISHLEIPALLGSHQSRLGLFGFKFDYPIVLMHGINTSETTMDHMIDWLREVDPTVHIHNMVIDDCSHSDWLCSYLERLPDAAAEFSRKIAADPYLQDGFDIIAHSQGTVLARGYLQWYNETPVRRFISLSGPHAGYFCGSNCYMLPEPWKAVADTFIGGAAYTQWGQDNAAPAGYWKDPLMLDEYLEMSCYISPLNCEVAYARNATLAENVNKLELLALFGDPSDGVIMPFQSAFFGFYENGTNVVLPLERSELYLEDYIGLATLDANGRLLQATSGLPHTHYCAGDDGKAFFLDSVVPLLETKKYNGRGTLN